MLPADSYHMLESNRPSALYRLHKEIKSYQMAVSILNTGETDFALLKGPQDKIQLSVVRVSLSCDDIQIVSLAVWGVSVSLTIDQLNLNIIIIIIRQLTVGPSGKTQQTRQHFHLSG